jgi:hypothetical protein
MKSKERERRDKEKVNDLEKEKEKEKGKEAEKEKGKGIGKEESHFSSGEAVAMERDTLNEPPLQTNLDDYRSEVMSIRCK